MRLADRIMKSEHVPPELGYPMNALEPFMSRETLAYHYGKHHRGYASKLNSQIRGTQYEDAGLEDIVKGATGTIFNNAAQLWNHNFFWRCLHPAGGGDPSAVVGETLELAFGSVEAFRQFFTKAAIEKFGSGWTWLVKLRDGRFVVRNTDDADCPLATGDHALLVCDVWEHAYYIDYRNDRSKYLDAYWKIVNWRFLEENLAAASMSNPPFSRQRASRR
ncbi:MAG TPA: Fe-Mn family superoxide dismutase [Burkholderiales bacterium]|nr:Fe-Mn family superoxide dismutase [Burkholderiales bacterium]